MKYRVVLTFDARDAKEAAAIVSSPDRMPPNATMRVIEADRSLAVRWGALAGLILAGWLVILMGAAKLWRSIP